MKKLMVIIMLILGIGSILFVGLAPEPIYNHGIWGVLISGMFFLYLACKWFLSRISIVFRKTFNIQVPQNVDNPQEKSLLSKFIAFISNIFWYGFIALVLFGLFYIFIAQPHSIDGNNMSPTIVDGQTVFSNKFIYRFSEPRRGDVIIFRSPQDERVDAISRIIAIPRDTIKLKGGLVIVNGEQLSEPYLQSGTLTIPGRFMTDNAEKTLGDNEYFVMSDKREVVNDSRSYGYVPRESIVGKVK